MPMAFVQTVLLSKTNQKPHLNINLKEFMKLLHVPKNMNCECKYINIVLHFPSLMPAKHNEV